MKSAPKPEDLALAKRAAAAIRKLYPEAEVILYGSRARGTPLEYSDLDLLVITHEKISWQEENQVYDSIFDLELESGVIISPIVHERTSWLSGKYQAIPLAKAINREGISL